MDKAWWVEGLAGRLVPLIFLGCSGWVGSSEETITELSEGNDARAEMS